MIQSGEAAKVVQTFFDEYLVQRDKDRTLDCLTDGVQWIGTGRLEMALGRSEVERALSEEFAQAPEPYTIEYGRMEETPVTDSCAIVLLAASLYPEAKGGDTVRLWVTSTCVECEGGGCKIASVHASTLDIRQGTQGIFPSSDLERDMMERQLGARALDLLGRSIPGGMMGAYLEPDFPLYYVNDFMLSYLGYTYEEFAEATDGKVINCVHPEDQEQVRKKIQEAVKNGGNYELQYRLQKKDGSYILVKAVGKVGFSEDGRKVCVGVARDISAEVEARKCLEKQKQRTLQYNHLLQSVLCGIVQYQLDGRKVVFKDANREAIHIFGYAPEEFWAVPEWDMKDMIAQEDREYILKAISKLQNPGEKTSFEYRLRKKGGTSCWIIGSAEVLADGADGRLIQSVFLDITERKAIEQRNQRLSERVEASNEILHLALEHTGTCEFYYYPETRECIVPKRTGEIYHCQERYKDMPRSFAMEEVANEYCPAFYEMFDKIHKGEKTAACEFHSRDGKFWCQETLSVILSSENGMPKLVIGIVENTTRQKEMEEALAEARSRDDLTGLYNKESGIKLIQEYLAHRAPFENGVLMLLDMDDFDDINQKEGTVFADAILQEVADILWSEIGPDNIEIRLGGDEFMVFIKNSSKVEAGLIGPQIAGQVRNILVDVEKNIHVSVSIGMCSTEVVDEYNALYRCAESTLKYVKEHGKGQAACYLDTSNELGVFLNQLYTEEHPVNDIELGTSRQDSDLVPFALDLLGKSRNLDDAVFLLLSRIGRIFHFDRVSIIEASRAYLTYRFSYQWARNHADLQLGQDFYVSDEDFDICEAMYDDDGLADHNVREGISHIASCLHAGIWNYGDYVGSMSFEVDQKNYQWTQEHRKLLKEMVRIVPSFIMKAKSDAVSQAKTEFLSRMSHEIRTPMNAISGMTTIAKSVLEDKNKTLECLEKIESANNYLLNLINDILDMSRIESGKMGLNYGSMDLERQMVSLKSLFGAQASEKNLYLYFENNYDGKRPLKADSLRLNQIMVNIIGNAIKFTEQGGIKVRVETLETEPRAVLCFSVTDTGIGIEQSALARIFSAFEQAQADTAARHGGTGLGLAISSRLVQMMGGTLDVRSEMGKGSEFFFTLTLEYAQNEPESAAFVQEESTSLPDFSGWRVLLAEDNELNCEIARTILEMNGFTVICAKDGSDALSKFCDDSLEPFDAILMDIRMPIMDGLEAARRIRTSGRPDARTIPIIALTANAFDEDTKKSMASGMNGHLSKPIQVEQMLKVLSQCIEGKKGTERTGQEFAP